LENRQKVTLSVYGVDGMFFDYKDLGDLAAGEHSYILSLSVPKGEYLLVLKKGGKKISKFNH